MAVSGGKDSVSLLHILAKIERKHPKSSLVAVTVDEGIKRYRDEALRIAAENCKKLGIEHKIVSFKKLFGYTLDAIVKLQKKERFAAEDVTACAICGVLRRKALNLAVRQNSANKLATAHTLDDETQTILLNIFHGDVLRIAREKPVTEQVHEKLVRRVKPFCEIPEKETALYAYIKNIKFQRKPCPYASDALRNDVRLMLNRMKEKHTGLKFTGGRMEMVIACATPVMLAALSHTSLTSPRGEFTGMMPAAGATPAMNPGTVIIVPIMAVRCSPC